MKKLELIQIMNLADKLNQAEWIGILMNLNNAGELEDFFKKINQTDMLNSILQSSKKQVQY